MYVASHWGPFRTISGARSLPSRIATTHVLVGKCPTMLLFHWLGEGKNSYEPSWFVWKSFFWRVSIPHLYWLLTYRNANRSDIRSQKIFVEEPTCQTQFWNLLHFRGEQKQTQIIYDISQKRKNDLVNLPENQSLLKQVHAYILSTSPFSSFV